MRKELCSWSKSLIKRSFCTVKKGEETSYNVMCARYRDSLLFKVCVTVTLTPKLEAAKRSEAGTFVEAVVWA